MLEKLLRKKRSILFTWLISYMFVLIIPVIIAAITYIMTAQVVEKQINSSNSIFLAKIQHQMDRQLIDARRLSQEISMNTRINNLLHSKGPLEAISGYDLFMAVQDLRSLGIPDDSIGDYYVYFKNIDFMISGYTSGDSRTFYNAYLSDMGITYRQWYEKISANYRGYYTTVLDLNKMGKPAKTIVFIRSIPDPARVNNPANIIITIDESIFIEDAKDIEAYSGGAVLILNRNNDMMASSNAFEGIEAIRYEDLKGNMGMHYQDLKGKKYIVSYITSQVDGWKYISVVPNSVFWEKAEYVRMLTIASLLLCILVGGVVTYFSVKRNYNPVMRLIKVLESKHGLNFEKRNNEYTFIQQVIDKIEADKEKVNSALKRQNKELKKEFLARLLKGRLGESFSVSDLTNYYDMHFKSDAFAVMIFYIEDYEEMFSKEENSGETDSYEKFRMVQFIITNVVEEMIGQKGNQGFMTDMDNMLVCLVNFSKEGVLQWKEELERVARESHEFLSRHFQIGYMVAVSNVHTTVTSIPGAYSEALQALEYKKVLGLGGGHILSGCDRTSEREFLLPAGSGAAVDQLY